MHRRAWGGWLAVCVLAGCGDNLSGLTGDESIQTRAPAEVRAGDIILVTCTRTTQVGVEMIDAELVVTPETAVDHRSSGLLAMEAGEVLIACALPEEGVIDPSPSRVRIVPGPAFTVTTAVEPNPIVAGGTLTASCEVRDAYGNLIEDAEPTLSLAPSDPGNTIEGLSALMTRAGQFTASCQVPGATGEGVLVDVLPALPASIVLGKQPDQSVYGVGDVVEITHVVSDIYGNTVPDAVVEKTTTPISGSGPATKIGADSFRYGGEGLYRVDASVMPPTEGDQPVTASIEVLVNSFGPAILCDSPADGSMMNVTPGSQITFQGTVNDINGISAVTVNGTAATLAPDGTFTAPITTRFGINFVEIEATDGPGAGSSAVCAFLAADQWVGSGDQLSGAVTLQLRQEAWDDGTRSGPINDFTDILTRVVNSTGLRTALHNALSDNNPLKPSSCDWEVIWCVLRSEVNYLSSVIGGPNTTQLSLVTGGVRAQARISDVRVQLRVRGELFGADFDTTGWVYVDYVDLTMILDTRLAAGQPDVSVRPGSVSVSVGPIDTDFGGIDGNIIDVVADVANGQIRSLLASTVRTFISDRFNGLLDDVIANLDISTFGTSFSVPTLDGGSIPVSFSVGFSSLLTSTTRMLFGVSTAFTAPIAVGYPTLGAPLPPGSVFVDPPGTTPAGVGAHIGIINQLAHALWRAGLLEVSLTGPDIAPDLPADVTLDVATRLPPVAYFDGSSVVLQIGGVEVAVAHPELPPNLMATVGVTARTSVSLQGSDLSFGSITIDELYVSSQALQLDAQERATLEDTVAPLLQDLINTTLNDALPSIPLPSFTIPASLAPYGLPAGQQLGITNPTLSTGARHFFLRGGFGIQP